ncbi:MAG: TonB-dependent receptor [Syntrophotaleaceae bacterium]
MLAPACGWAISDADLLKLSLEELTSLEVTSSGRKLQKVSEAPMAVYVIHQEDIRRSGATSIPEALRLVPGVSVARIDGSTWAIAIRGFNGRFLNKLQVLIDGRSVYSPPFSTVHWDMQDTLLDDIERIEVVRGPGGTLWGANAVNGVINIITKKAGDTQGTLVKAGYGTEEEGFAAVRYGGTAGERADYRAFVKYFNRDSLNPNEYGYLGQGEAHDDWNAFRGGFRLDVTGGSRDDFTLQGEAYSGTEGQQDQLWPLDPTLAFNQRVVSDTQFAGGFLLGSWQHQLADGGDLTLKGYYDRSYRDEQVLGKAVWDVFDVDFQHRFFLGQRQEMLWGLGYRLTRDDVEDGDLVTFEDGSASDQLFSLFLQDEITLIPQRLRLLLGSKFEHNDYTGFEYQPNARLVWTPNQHHTLWAAVSRAVRTPSRLEDNGNIFYTALPAGAFFPGPFPVRIDVYGNKDFDSEKILSYELGYRFLPQRGFSIDTALFYTRYRDHRSAEPLPPSFETEPIDHILLAFNEDNKLEAEAWGLEIAVDWHVFHWWRLQGNYSLLKLNLTQEKGSGDFFSPLLYEDSSPQQQCSLRSSFDLGRNWDLDLWLRYVDSVSVYFTDVNDYFSLDVRLAWRPVKGLELALVGQNLIENEHTEFQVEFGRAATVVPRGIYGQVKWQF